FTIPPRGRWPPGPRSGPFAPSARVAPPAPGTLGTREVARTAADDLSASFTGSARDSTSSATYSSKGFTIPPRGRGPPGPTSGPFAPSARVAPPAPGTLGTREVARTAADDLSASFTASARAPRALLHIPVRDSQFPHVGAGHPDRRAVRLRLQPASRRPRPEPSAPAKSRGPLRTSRSRSVTALRERSRSPATFSSKGFTIPPRGRGPPGPRSVPFAPAARVAPPPPGTLGAREVARTAADGPIRLLSRPPGELHP